MKRIVIALPFWAMAAVCLPGMVQPVMAAPVACVGESMDTEIPWSTVEGLLHQVTELRPYSFTQLKGWYEAGTLTVSQLGSGYEVRIVDEDGICDVLILNQG